MAIFNADLINSVGMNNNSAVARPPADNVYTVAIVSQAKQSTEGEQQGKIEMGNTPFTNMVQWSLDMSQNYARIAENRGIEAFLTLI